MAESNSTQVPSPAVLSRRIERERRRLNKAAAVLSATIDAAEQGMHRDLIADCVRVGRDLVNTAVTALDSVRLSRPVGERERDA